MGTVAKVSAITSSLAHRGGATMGDWQLRWPGGAATGCVSMVVRVLWSESGRAIQVCPTCRDAQGSSGLWTLQLRPQVRWADARAVPSP